MTAEAAKKNHLPVLCGQMIFDESRETAGDNYVYAGGCSFRQTAQ